eukprot:TRINITY_DN11935_c0_g1_i1.p1 TRINITY_DN11935_c0_g1~~TRINITY_DN11935_c0_g1_i1.p1  ORF type:complete len:475 (+),score=74.11 TRINITY_DN11935_c0_g1_i1:65-1426(+)
MSYKFVEVLTFVLLLSRPWFACCSDVDPSLLTSVCTDLGKEGSVTIWSEDEREMACQLAAICIDDVAGAPSKDLEPYILPDALVLEPALASNGNRQEGGWILRNMTRMKTTDVRSPIPVVLSSLKDQIRSADEKLLEDSIFSGQSLKRFRDCVSKGCGGSTLKCCAPLFMELWRLAAKRLEEATTRKVRNEIMRVIAQAWGEPEVLVDILETIGCSSPIEEHMSTYDEFSQCRIPEQLEQGQAESGLELVLHVYQRAIAPSGQEWECSTCTFHAHDSWMASRMVAGSVTHTLTSPTCLAEADFPTFDSLDSFLAESDNGTKVDVVGTRYSLPEQPTAWETKEVTTVRAGQTVLISPAWHHRVIPPPRNTSKTSITFLARWRLDPEPKALKDDDITGQRFQYTMPDDLAVASSDLHRCWELPDLIAELRSGGDFSEGISKLPCKKRKRGFSREL